MDTKKVLFRRKFRGYDRNAVNEYILGMNRSFSEESTARDSALAEAERALSESREKIASLETALSSGAEASKADSDRIDQLARELELARAENTELESLAVRKEERFTEISELAEKRGAQIAALAEELRQKQGELSSLRTKLEEERAVHDRELSSLRTQLDDERTSHARELAAVRAQCEKKLAEHSGELEALRAEYDLETGARIAALEMSCTQMRERVSSELRELTKKCLREVLSGVKGMRDDLGRVQTTSTVRADRMIRSIDEYEADMKTEVRRLLEEFRTDTSE